MNRIQTNQVVEAEGRARDGNEASEKENADDLRPQENALNDDMGASILDLIPMRRVAVEDHTRLTRIHTIPD